MIELETLDSNNSCLYNLDHRYIEEFMYDFLLNGQILFNLLVHSVPMWLILSLRTTHIKKLGDYFQIAYPGEIYELRYLDHDISELFQYMIDCQDYQEDDRLLFYDEFWIKITILLNSNLSNERK